MNTVDKINTFKWRDRFGEFHSPALMETRHLFYTLRMIWNSTMPVSAKLPGNAYGFSSFYSRSYMLVAIYSLAKELSTRKNMTKEWSDQLGQMMKWLATNQITHTSDVEVLAC